MARSSKKPVSKTVLGNDPFLRGAAPHAPAPEPAAPPPADPPPLQAVQAPEPVAPPPAAEAPRQERPERKSRPPASRPAPEPLSVHPEPLDSARDGLRAEGAKPSVHPERSAEGAKSKEPELHAVPPEPAPEPREDAAQPQTLARRVLIPEVESGEPAAPEPAPERRGGPLAALREAANGRVAALASRLAASPTVLNVAAATISATSAVRALVAAPAEPPRVDDFGEDASLVERTAPALEFFYRHYWRVTVEGAEHLPRGKAFLSICNHAGALPLDGPVVRSALERSAPEVHARWLVEDAIFHAPFLGTWLNRLGAVRACPENALRLLEQGHAVAVFPEGLWGIQKTFRRRYQLQRFGRGGFVKLALKTGAPMIPTAVVGAEEAMPILATIPAKALGVPFIPVTPTGLVPLPAKWTVAFSAPLDLSAYGPEDAQDMALVQRLTEEVRERIHEQLKRLLAERRSVFRSA